MCRIAVLLLVCLSALAQEKEAALGKQLAKDFHPIDNPAVQEYVETLGGKLAVQIDPNRSFTFGVVADDRCPSRHEPTALPGGYVFVPAALFLAAENEAQFARMLAHAMAHIVQGFPTLQNTQKIPLIFVGGCYEGISIPKGIAAAESAAETLAAEVMAKVIIASPDDFAEVRRLLTPPPRADKPPTLRR